MQIERYINCKIYDQTQGLMGGAKWAYKGQFYFQNVLIYSNTCKKKKPKYMVMISMMPSTLIVKFGVPGSGVQALVQDDNGLIVKMYQIFYSTPI